jgi:hypothetical protein
MISKIEVFVGSDLVGAFYMDPKQTQFLARIVEAVKHNPTIVELTDLEEVPEVGMKYDGKNFFAKPGLHFSVNNFHDSQKVFGLIVNSTLAAIQHLEIGGMDHYIAAYQSNPTFKISEVENDES